MPTVCSFHIVLRIISYHHDPANEKETARIDPQHLIITLVSKETMETNLEALSFPVAISDGLIVDEETTITVECHDRVFQSVTVLDEAGQTIYTAEGKGMGSWSWRRTVKDASGRSLFDLRHFGYGMKNKWAVESPDGREICSLQHVTYMNKERSALDAVVRNEAAKGEEVTVEVRPMDRGALRTMVSIEDTPVTEFGL